MITFFISMVSLFRVRWQGRESRQIELRDQWSRTFSGGDASVSQTSNRPDPCLELHFRFGTRDNFWVKNPNSARTRGNMTTTWNCEKNCEKNCGSCVNSVKFVKGALPANAQWTRTAALSSVRSGPNPPDWTWSFPPFPNTPSQREAEAQRQTFVTAQVTASKFKFTFEYFSNMQLIHTDSYWFILILWSQACTRVSLWFGALWRSVPCFVRISLAEANSACFLRKKHKILQDRG